MLHAVPVITRSYKHDSPAHSSAAGSGEEDVGRLECEQHCAYISFIISSVYWSNGHCWPQ